jgi:hypothetical protein
VTSDFSGWMEFVVKGWVEFDDRGEYFEMSTCADGGDSDCILTKSDAEKLGKLLNLWANKNEVGND